MRRLPIRSKGLARVWLWAWAIGVTTTIAVSYANGINPWTGESLNINKSVLNNANSSSDSIKIWRKKQPKNKRQKFIPEFFHIFPQIPCGSSHQSIDPDADYTPKVIFQQPVIIF
jgi:hypothetical protein